MYNRSNNQFTQANSTYIQTAQMCVVKPETILLTVTNSEQTFL